MWVFKPFDFIPQGINLLFAIALDIFQFRTFIYTNSFVKKPSQKLFSIEISYHLSFPCILRIKYFIRLILIYSFIVSRKHIRYCFSSLFVKKPPNLFKSWVCYFAYIFAKLYLWNDFAIFFNSHQFVY